MYIGVNGHNINYEFINKHLLTPDNPVVVFLHEGLGSIKQWKKFPKTLCDELNMCGLVYDRFGYGLSDALPEPRKIDFLHNEAFVVLPTLLQNLSINNKLILFGHSDGATIALIYATLHSSRLFCVISEAAHVFIEDISANGIRAMRDSYINNENIRKMFAKYHQYHADELVLGWTEAWLSPEFLKWDIQKSLQLITAPVLAIQGSFDEYGSYDQLESIQKNVSAPVNLVYIENCGHSPHTQVENKVMQVCTEFIFKIITSI